MDDMSVISDIQTPTLSRLAARFLDIVATGDSTALVDLFTDGAAVRDWGHLHVGRDGIARWNEQDFLGAGVTLDVHKLACQDDGATIVTTVRGPRFTGPSTFVLVPTGEKIRQLVITG